MMTGILDMRRYHCNANMKRRNEVGWANETSMTKDIKKSNAKVIHYLPKSWLSSNLVTVT